MTLRMNGLRYMIERMRSHVNGNAVACANGDRTYVPQSTGHEQRRASALSTSTIDALGR
jgi:hypothetical protein